MVVGRSCFALKERSDHRYGCGLTGLAYDLTGKLRVGVGFGLISLFTTIASCLLFLDDFCTYDILFNVECDSLLKKVVGSIFLVMWYYGLGIQFKLDIKMRDQK